MLPQFLAFLLDILYYWPTGLFALTFFLVVFADLWLSVAPILNPPPLGGAPIPWEEKFPTTLPAGEAPNINGADIGCEKAAPPTVAEPDPKLGCDGGCCNAPNVKG